MKRSYVVFACHLLLAACYGVPCSFADTAGTDYAISSEHFAGGGAPLTTSANYKLEEGTIDRFAKNNLASTNYKVDGKIGVSGQHDIALISAVSPGDYARYYTDQSTSFTVTAKDPDNDTLQYRAKQDGTTKAGPQASNILAWALSVSDKGRRVLSMEVIDQEGNVVKPQAMYVYRRPVK